MMNTIKAAKDILSTIFVIAAFVISITATIYGCGTEPRPSYYHKIYKKTDDGKYIHWAVKSNLEFRDGFVCWATDNKGNFCISGDITIVPIKYSLVVDENGVTVEKEE